jgi:hypothetical protein
MGDCDKRLTGEFHHEEIGCKCNQARPRKQGDLMSDIANGTGRNNGQVSEVVAEPAHESDVQVIQGSERKEADTALVTQYGVSRQESTFMPAMSMEVALARRAAIVEFTRKIMVRDLDFGEIPGTNKPALLKPGAEKLCNFFGLEPEFTPVAEEIDWTGAQHGGETFCYVRYRCRLLRHSRILGVGEGSCNSWESRYRYRWVASERIPEHLDRTRLLKRGGHQTLCEFEFAIERAETTGVYGKPAEHWKKFQQAISAGKARRVERDTRQGKSPVWEIDVDMTLYRVPNPDIADLINTIQKMGQKRALVAATLIATSASEFFTQDVEDTPPDRDTFGVMTDPAGRSHSARAEEEHAGGSRLQIHAKKPAASDNYMDPTRKPWKNFGEMRQFFERMRERVGEPRYFDELNTAGVTNPVQFKSTNKAVECYSRLLQIAAELEVA